MRLRPAPWFWCPLVLVVDLLTKRYVLAHATRFAARIPVLGDVARFAYVRNPGAAMGLLPGGRWFLVAVSVVLVGVLIHYYRRTTSPVRRGALAAILGGAMGNLVDRLFYGGLVVDFIDLGLGRHRFYTFNVADMGVTLGGAVLIWSLWRRERTAAPRDPAPTLVPPAGSLPPAPPSPPAPGESEPPPAAPSVEG